MIKIDINSIFKGSILKIKVLLVSFILSIVNIYGQDIKINEFCASNTNNLVDENGDFPDWVEIYNPGPEDIDLQGYGLSDDKNSLLKWTFPPYDLKADEYLVLYASGKNSDFLPGFWNAIITEGDNWKYTVPLTELPTNWTSSSFDESAWLEGPSGFGYGDGDDNTILNTPLLSVFLRKTFSIDDVGSIQELFLSIDYDDAFVAYLNGTEIARENIGVPKIPPAYNATAINYIEPVMINGGKPNNYDLKSSIPLLKNGENILAIQVHNHSEGSSDLSAIPFLSFKSSSKLYDNPNPILGLNSSSFHTNFKLNKDGDSIYISFPNGTEKEFVGFGKTQSDVSYGFPNETGTELKAFPSPSPWLSNNTQAYNYSNSNEVYYSKKSGYYRNSISLNLSSNNTEDKIYFTTNGADPDESSTLYTNAIVISETTTVKARIVNPGYLPGEVYTMSYSTQNKTGFPSLFISTDPFNLWDNEVGMYVLGSNAQSGNPYYGANFWEDWEKPAHIEYFDMNGDSAFSINAGIKIFGGWSRAREQKSFSIFARNEYGDKNIPYKIFEDKDIEEFEAFVIRNSGNDSHDASSSWGTMYRDVLMTRIAGLSDVDIQAGRPITVYLNGEYWGIYNIREKVNEHYISSNHSQIDPDRLNLLMSDKQIIQGSNADYLALENFIDRNPLNSISNYDYVKTKMDMSNYIDYIVAQIYFGNTDWPGNNIKFWKFDAEYSKWRWILYDTDFGMGLYNHGAEHNTITFATSPNGNDWPNPPWSTFLLRNLMTNQEFKYSFINAMADRMNTVFKPDYLNSEIDKLKLLYQDEIRNHIARWGGNYNNWKSAGDNLKYFANERPGYMKTYIRSYFNIYTNRTINLSASGCPDASLKLNTLILKDLPWNGQYFDNIPVQVRAITPKGYRFLRWEGSVNSTQQELTLDMKSAKSLTAIYEEYTEKEYEDVIINEIAYNNPNGSMDWVEIFNNSTETRDISNWVLKDSDPNHKFKISSNTLLLPYEYLVISQDQESYYNTYSNIDKTIGNSNFGFSLAGECLKLYNAEMDGIDSVCYATEYPWPGSPVTTGFPIALSKPNTDNNQGYNWNIASQLEGTPASQNYFYVDVPSIESNINSEFILYQNYPNPFSEETRIAFHLNQGDNINIDIYNLNGILVSHIENNFYSAGYHEIVWESGNINSGIYILKVSDSKTIQQKRLFINK